MKKLWISLALILLLLSTLAFPVSAEEVDGNSAVMFWENIDFEAMKAWFTAEVLPHLATVGTILGVAMVELIPAIRSLIKAKGAFTKVAQDVDAYNQAKIEYDMRVEEREKEFEARIEKLQEEYNKRIEEFNKIAKQFENKLEDSAKVLEQHLVDLDKNATKVERMCYLAFTNSGELVSNGIAHHIADVDKERAVWEEDDDAD